jgi:hypothetical protein
MEPTMNGLDRGSPENGFISSLLPLVGTHCPRHRLLASLSQEDPPPSVIYVTAKISLLGLGFTRHWDTVGDASGDDSVVVAD